MSTTPVEETFETMGNDGGGGLGVEVEEQLLDVLTTSPQDALEPAGILLDAMIAPKDEAGQLLPTVDAIVGQLEKIPPEKMLVGDGDLLGGIAEVEDEFVVGPDRLLDGAETESNDDDEVELRQQSRAAASAPSIATILRYTVPAIGIWLCSPVLSAIDTAAVGLLAGTAQQAALNPAVSVTDYGALLVAFMYTATTNLIAGAGQEEGERDGGNVMGEARSSSTTRTTTLVTALKIASLVGTVLGVLLMSSGETLLRRLIGNDALDPAVFSAALRYVRIRSLGMPAMVMIGTAQSACLGMQDVRSPLYVLAAAAGVNFLGDVLLVGNPSPWLGGAAGAAWATVASQYAALAFFARWLFVPVVGGSADRDGSGDGGRRRRRMKWFPRKSLARRKNEERMNVNADGAGPNAGGNREVVSVTRGIMELTGTSSAGRTRRGRFRDLLASYGSSKRTRNDGGGVTTLNEFASSDIEGDRGNDIIRPTARKEVKARREELPPNTRGFLSGSNVTPLNFFSFSKSNFDSSKASEFLPFVVPVTTTSLGRISGWVAMSHVASSALGKHDMAAHQIVLSAFMCLATFVDALNQVAQGLVPAVFERKDRDASRARDLRETVGNFGRVGGGLGMLLAGLTACMSVASRLFTSDPMVLGRVNGAIPGVALFSLAHGLVCAGEGSLLGQKDLKFLRNMYAIFFLTVPAYMLRLKHRALTGAQAVGIGTLWTAFATYNVIRASIWGLRLAQLQRRTESEVVPLALDEEKKFNDGR